MEEKMDFLNNVIEMLDKGKCQDSNYDFLVPRTNLFTFFCYC